MEGHAAPAGPCSLLSFPHAMKLRTILADHDALFLRRLSGMLAEFADVEVVRECGAGGETAAAARELEPDLLFLDVRLPGLDGFSVLDALGGDRRARAVFVTSDPTFAVRAFEAGALDYLLKPVIPARLALALDRDKLSDLRGVLTPAAAMGDALLSRLPAAGVTLETARLS